ncbi:mediator of RNA polymerase II transcription subunit 27 [Exaiptasia diaphana]|uniref:Mediator complex subunit 27 n=1 Tax=Exaiptasia diaphana TaxID=2652724 RepID=A0A913XMI6_EXADI|nr:mediator of RNA polymerase II transcription subunit 27 [Exaiptasia diaphana]
MAEKNTVIEQCLSSTKGLRSSVSQLFEDFVSKPISSTDKSSQEPLKSAEFVQDLKKHFGNIQKSVSNIEKSAAQVSHMKTDFGTIALGSAGLISLDPGDDKTQLYKDLVGTYNWHEKLHTQSQQAVSCMKRIHPCSAKRSDEGVKKPRYGVSSSKSDMRVDKLDKLIQYLRQKHSNLRILLFRISGALMLEITVPKTFKAMVVLKGIGIDQVIIRGINETANEQKEDLWTPSKHLVFQKLTDYATSAFLHYSTTGEPVVKIVSFLCWIDSFQGLFSKKCTKCGNYLEEDDQNTPLPPCWRTYDTLLPYHYKCYSANLV